MTKRLLDYLKEVYNFIPNVGGFLANLAICTMTVLVAVIATLRYGFSWTPGWGDSICAFLVAFTVFMGAGHTLLKGEHVRILFVLQRLPARVQSLVEVICSIIALLYVGYLIYATAGVALMSLRLQSRTPDGLLLFPLQMCLPIGLFMFFVALVGFMVRSIRRTCTPSSGKGETQESDSTK